MDLVPQKRKLDTYKHDLTEQQVLEKDLLMKQSKELYPNLSSYMIELAVDFAVRHPQELSRIIESKEWENTDSIHSPANLLQMLKQ